MTITRRQFIEAVGRLATVASVSSLVASDDLRPVDRVRLIGSNKVMFVDHEFIAKSDGVRLKLHPPRKTGERLVESEHPWESATLNWFSVLHDEDRYRMWYECYDVEGWPTADDTSFCYAESSDGIRWTKPKLGLVSYRGNKDNNILFRQVGEGQHRSRVHGSGVLIDPSAPPEARYKCVSQGLFQGIGDRPHYVAGMTSPDGLRWTRVPQPICPVFADSQYSGFWDTQQRRYVIVGRVSGRGGRAIGRSASDRFDGFEPFTRVLETDEHDPPESDLYNPACQQYPGSPGLYLMFPSLFRHREDTLDIRLVSVTAGNAGGQFDTPLIRFTGDRLVVNAAAHPGGTVRVGLLDADDRPIPGRGAADCRALSDDKESWTVSWADGHCVARLSEQSIRLQIELPDADVFGFQFQSKP